MIDFRYEKKFLINNVDVSNIELLVKNNPYYFIKSYPTRFVNNIYYDSFKFHCYYDNIEGNTNRKKYRVRWYNDLLGKVLSPRLEVKVKKGELGFKDTYTFP